MKTSIGLLLLALAAGTACTKPNPAVCCLDTADCNAAGISEVRGCAEGLACVENQCEVATCAQAGCAAGAPVCNLTTGVCDPCASVDDCARFADAPVCEMTSGACVECAGPSDCPSTMPICDANACRAPRSDDDCPSGAMAEDGSCVAQADVVYIDPGGSDAGSCTRTVPCRSLEFAVSKTTAARNHIVFATGQYDATQEVTFGPNETPAAALYVHGHGAELLGPNGEGCSVRFNLSSTVRDLRITARSTAMQTAVCVTAGPTTLERVHITGMSGTRGVAVSASTTVRDFIMTSGYDGIAVFGASLTLDRAVIHQTHYGITTQGTTSIQLSNLLIYGTTNRALDLVSGTSGTVSSSTFVSAGAGVAAGTRTVACPTTVLVRSSIVWAPGAGALAPISGCNMTNVIAGPAVVAGASNSDPMFVDLAQNNYHLAAGSPARDAVDSGPATDFEGDARPQGARFDIGADEAAP